MAESKYKKMYRALMNRPVNINITNIACYPNMPIKKSISDLRGDDRVIDLKKRIKLLFNYDEDIYDLYFRNILVNDNDFISKYKTKGMEHVHFFLRRKNHLNIDVCNGMFHNDFR